MHDISGEGENDLHKINGDCNCNCNVKFDKRANSSHSQNSHEGAIVRMFSDYLAIQICFQFKTEFTIRIRHRRIMRVRRNILPALRTSYRESSRSERWRN